MAEIVVTIFAELSPRADALEARASLVTALDSLLPYMFENVLVTSDVMEEDLDSQIEAAIKDNEESTRQLAQMRGY